MSNAAMLVQPSLPRRVSRALVSAFAILGVALTGLIGTGFVLDVLSVDRTRGGYEPPYTDYRGTPIDWNAADLTDTGMVMRGYVSNSLLNCTSGMLSFQIFGRTFDYRPVSLRALAIHKPREACIARGFAPEF